MLLGKQDDDCIRKNGRSALRALKRVVGGPLIFFRIFTFSTPGGGGGGSSDPILGNYPLF